MKKGKEVEYSKMITKGSGEKNKWKIYTITAAPLLAAIFNTIISGSFRSGFIVFIILTFAILMIPGTLIIAEKLLEKIENQKGKRTIYKIYINPKTKQNVIITRFSHRIIGSVEDYEKEQKRNKTLKYQVEIHPVTKVHIIRNKETNQIILSGIEKLDKNV